MIEDPMDWAFPRIKRLPQYVFSLVNELKYKLRREGEDVVDLGMGNPNMPPAKHIIDKLCEVAQKPNVHGYSASRGIPRLRKAICNFYEERYGVKLDPEREAILTIGAKEGYSHLMLAMISPGDTVIVPNPTYPIHYYAPIIAGGEVHSIPLNFSDDQDHQEEFLRRLYEIVKTAMPKPKAVVISFPHNPTTITVEKDFFKEIVKFAKEHGLWIIHDFAYADIAFDGYKPPSILEIEGAKDVAVELYSMSKGFSMAGWRVAFVVGNEILIKNLAHLKSYLDYGIFTPIQVASIIALESPYEIVEKTAKVYQKRRDVLVEGLNRLGWKVKKPKATMFVWAKIPEWINMNSLDFSLFLLKEAKVAVSPGVGFGQYGEGYVRFALVENEHRIRQAIRGIRKAFRKLQKERKLEPERSA
ncbi:aminotransferase class I/II-fold pyridoxal phosphate-dependent enzyme [Aquifex aeolicus]|uniref:Aminotransferase n=1 Tax=Aquifex aeolicus (strain VF5) TaxID=224324 RepID=O67864_AQUAE|nr:aminotransferase class I/II-fold pyridoxal phosphate-dependent enzyme [Aquifex aeolicus]AAC07823.1 aminotransferase (AspC family) [Aquifex aeolicus VF5]